MASTQELALIEECINIKKALSRDIDPAAALEMLSGLESYAITKEVLRGSLIGKAVNEVYKKEGMDATVREKAKRLVLKWKALAQATPAKPDGKPGVTATSTSKPSSHRREKTSEKVLHTFRPMDSSAKNEKNKEKRLKIREKMLDVLKMEVTDMDGTSDKKDLLDPEKVIVDMEEELWSQLVKKDDDKPYLTQIRSILFNLKDAKNPNFNYKILAGFFKPEDIPTMTAEEMASEMKQAERAKHRQESMEEIQSDWAMKHGQVKISGMFTCGKCKGTQTTYFQMQTRSSDEPMTTFVTCLICNNRWKFC